MRATTWPRSSRDDLFEQPLELADVAVDGLLELAVAAILLADLVERLLALHGVEAPGEDVALAALVAVPQLGGGVVIDHPRDVDRERVERLDACGAARPSRRAGGRVVGPVSGARRGAAARRASRCGRCRCAWPGPGLSDGDSARRGGGIGAAPVMSARRRHARPARGGSAVRGGLHARGFAARPPAAA